MKQLSLVVFFLSAIIVVNAQYDSVLLYPHGVPGAIVKNQPEKVTVNPQDGVTVTGDVQIPVLYIHRPAHPNGTAVLICPGGGYFVLAMDHEGHHIADWFTQRGITAFVLKSRLPNENFMTEKSIRPLQDAQRAMQLIRSNAAAWKIDPSRLGIMGFSAGGHLASTVATHFYKVVGEMPDNTISVRPDFQILLYPMISYQPGIMMAGMKNQLLGDNPSKSLIDEFSNELHVTANTPPAFISLANNDPLPPENSLVYYTALRKNKVPVELHIFETGGHGYALSKKQRGHVEQWDRELEGWLRDRKLLAP